MTTIRLSEVPIGPLLAEGGEGRVHEVPGRAGVVYKAYRRPVAAGPLDALVRWPTEALAGRPDMGERVARATAWPTGVVVDERQPSRAAGVLMPRAPRRFSVRHRDGRSRLASLSYLTADPARRQAAYGVPLPPSATAERFGLVYALARILEAFESGAERIVHGDLSAKNVLWSLQRGPELFLIDCDNGERFDVTGRLLGDSERRRAMTPNWDDPQITTGANPGPASDRYALALIFLRVVGAAHFPIQKRQKQGELLTIDVSLPATHGRPPGLRADAPVWEACGRGLSLHDPEGRPAATAWVAVLAQILDDLGASDVRAAVEANQTSLAPARPRVPARPRLSTPPAGASAPRGSEVTVRPVPSAARSRQWQVALPALAPVGTAARPVRALVAGGFGGAGAAS
ncbi:MAG: hypothetical protein ACRDXE_10085, partial [Acidimicrobiales bacterium]